MRGVIFCLQPGTLDKLSSTSNLSVDLECSLEEKKSHLNQQAVIHSSGWELAQTEA